MRDMEDIDRKSRVCLLMEKYIGLVRDTPKIKEPVKKQIIRRLFLPYYARILKQYKTRRNPIPTRGMPREIPSLPFPTRKRNSGSVR